MATASAARSAPARPGRGWRCRSSSRSSRRFGRSTWRRKPHSAGPRARHNAPHRPADRLHERGSRQQRARSFIEHFRLAADGRFDETQYQLVCESRRPTPRAIRSNTERLGQLGLGRASGRKAAATAAPIIPASRPSTQQGWQPFPPPAAAAAAGARTVHAFRRSRRSAQSRASRSGLFLGRTPELTVAYSRPGNSPRAPPQRDIRRRYSNHAIFCERTRASQILRVDPLFDRARLPGWLDRRRLRRGSTSKRRPRRRAGTWRKSSREPSCSATGSISAPRASADPPSDAVCAMGAHASGTEEISVAVSRLCRADRHRHEATADTGPVTEKLSMYVAQARFVLDRPPGASTFRAT